MNSDSPSTPSSAESTEPGIAKPDGEARRTRTPLVPANVGTSIGEDADPEQDIAPNLGGEEQMQDA
jgi:hypothetical protein